MKKILLFLALPMATLAQEKKLITLDDLYKKGTFRTEFIQGYNSTADGKAYTELTKQQDVEIKSFATNTVDRPGILAADVKDENGKAIPLYDFNFSADEKQLLVFKDRDYIYRRSSKALTYVHNIAAKTTQLIDAEPVLHASFNPAGTHVAYVKNNNLFVYDIANKTAKAITNDGKWNEIINGNCDWVYEEEFEFTQAFQWSENGTYIAYYKFDESKVPTYDMTMFESLYPQNYSYKYPKAGEANSVVTIHIYNTKTGSTQEAKLNKEVDSYVPRIRWSKADDKLAVAWLNRLQNHLQWMLVDANSGAANVFYEEKDSRYVEINDDLRFLKNGKQFLFTSERDGIRDVYLGELATGKFQRLLNSKYEITEIVGIDEAKNRLFLTLAQPSTDRLFYVYDLKGKKLQPVDVRPGTHSIQMNEACTYYMHSYSNLHNPPLVSLVNVDSILTVKKYQPRVLKNNFSLIATADKYALGKPSFFYPVNAMGDTLNAWMLKPYNFDSTKKYPVLFCNYGGPGSQQVANRWGAVNFWQQMLSQKGYIIVCVDNAGTGYKGADFKKKTYLQLGKYEIADQIEVAKQLGNVPYIDKARIGHWGWSFGGFMSSLAITKGADVFKAAVAVAPVTNWRFYDNIYTERFMALPKDNKAGYDDNSPLSHVGKIKGKYLIIHGTADDNVHFQNAVMMVDEMIKKNIDFESSYYPNKNHGIRGGNTSYHLYAKMTDFILKNL
ncbi:MAG: S9 family peptidase [Bacteroidetes bacterium]|nr:MAG: S9 family peptidase [Bacteroidota bacterium]TAE71438.1 MAG: S9 family peptidase [Bacteroidota bacterium]TAF93721.1 MAG: S9 family peptidase [Bacteroidota bacterium]